VNTARHAERAVLGALLLDPTQTDAVDWLRPDDFGIPQHEIAFRTILAVHDGDEPATPERVLAAALADPDARRNRVDGPFLHTLIATTPAASRAALYGRMVLEASIHRAVAHHAGHLDYVAQAAPLETALEETAAAQEHVTRLEQRWRAVAEGAAEPPYEPSHDPASTPPPDPHALPAETRLLASLLGNPGQLTGIRGWLEPDDLSHPGLRATYTALCRLHSRGDPIDYITVAWEVGRADNSARLSPDDLAALSRTALPGQAAHAGCEVLAHSARRQLRRAAASLESAAMRPQHGPTRLLAYAQSRLTSALGIGDRITASRGRNAPPPNHTPPAVYVSRPLPREAAKLRQGAP
jgi:replicative DNA helicase